MRMKQFVAILCLFPFAASAQLRKAGTTPDIHPDYLRVAQGQIGRDQPDSAIATLNEAVATGADRASVAQFLLVSGNMLYGSNDAATPPQRKDYQRAASLLVASDSIVPSPETKYVLGVTEFKIADLAVRENSTAKHCDLARLAQSSLSIARQDIVGGESIDRNTSSQLLRAIERYRPAVQDQVTKYCK